MTVFVAGYYLPFLTQHLQASVPDLSSSVNQPTKQAVSPPAIMIRQTLSTTASRIIFISSPRAQQVRHLNSRPRLLCKARIGQILEQTQSVLPVAYETVKAKADEGKKGIDARRNQLVLLVKHSLGKDSDTRGQSLHEKPWGGMQGKEDKGLEAIVGGDQTKRCDISFTGLTVWPYLWSVRGLRIRRIGTDVGNR
ncbi:hypothetical protein P280DRAFT_471399 [Massarina eburnea CBS 473.64]|uniref:Uncharacterized protein n=1 Tax=Massarina eburnea CBS 473.64 TaxID=1395130 RepID=A0A6A6RU87_9PLEO|nr:hypothetical protein P280DRAFT_471399 [Massarina eburnea CBS 473.64]